MRVATFSRMYGAWWNVAVICLLLLGQANAADIPFGQGMLFKVYKPGVSPSYVFGTIHTDDERVTNIPERVRLALEEVDRVAMEVKLDESSMLLSATKMVFADGRTLPKVLGEELYGRTVLAVAPLGIPEVALRQLKPWAVVTLLSIPQAETGRFLDLLIYNAARDRGVEVMGLETVSEQLSLFETLTDEEQATLLKDTLNNLDLLPIVFEKLIQTYLKRDLAGLVRISKEMAKKGDPKLERILQERLVDNRNKRMVDRMLPMLEKGSLFVGVGALHLPGKTGILFILDGLGYNIDRVY